METVKRILGEEVGPEEVVEPESETPSSPARPGDSERRRIAPEDSEVDELANLWITGNKHEVATRFMAMDNETCVNLVFAIGQEGALELARMVDLMLEQVGPEEGAEEGAEAEGMASTEPAHSEPPPEDPGHVRELLGKTAEV